MIKRAGNIIIMVLLLIATGGVPVTRHYCGAAQRSFSIYATPKSCCKGPCNKCHNVFKFTKVNDEFEAGSSCNAQSLTSIFTLHTSFFIRLSESLLTTPLPYPFIRPQKLFTDEAGHSPASLGNFRC